MTDTSSRRPRALRAALRRTAALTAALALAACGGGGGGTPARVAPTITVAPAPLTVGAGGAATFAVAATGNPAPQLQWERSADGTTWTAVPGATDPSFLLDPATVADDGARFRAVASNGVGAPVASAPAVLTVTHLVLDLNPEDRVVEAPGAASFTVAARGNPAPAYQWQRSTDGGQTWSDLGGATSATLDLATTALADDAVRFRARLANGVSPALTSAAALLTVHQGPAFTLEPAGATIAAGGAVTFTVATTGNPAPQLQWERSADGTTWTAVPGATGASFLLDPATIADDGARFRAVAANGIGAPAASAAAVLAVTYLVLDGQPVDRVVEAPGTASFTVTARGNPAPAYQWQRSTDGGRSWADLAGAASSTLVTPATALADHASRFRARLTNGVSPAVTSAAALLTVHQGPAFTLEPAGATVAAGGPVTFTVAATGNPAPQLQWERSADGTTWTAVPGETGASFLLDPAAIADDGARFRAVASNGIGAPVASAAAVLTVTHLRLLTAPASRTVIAPAAATFTASAEGTPAPEYQWQRSTDGGQSWADLAGATSSSYVTPATALADHGTRFRVRVANGVSADVTSAAATLSVHIPPAFLVGPRSQVVSDGDGATFAALAFGNPAPTYRWERSPDGESWSAVPGATAATLAMTAALADDGLRLRVVLDNGVGPPVTGDAVRLGVRPLLEGHWERIADGPPVSQPAVAYDPASGRAVLFGGSAIPAPGERAIDQTWIWDSAALTWTQIAPAGDVPSPRLSMDMAFDQASGEAVLHGGWFSPDLSDPGHPPPAAALGTFTFRLDTRTWTYRGQALGPVDCFAIGYDTDAERVRIFGGQSVMMDPSQPDYGWSRFFDQVWTWEPSTEEWPGVQFDEAVGVRAGPRWAYDRMRHRFVLFGGGYPGWCGSFPCTYHQDTWEYDPATLAWVRTTEGDLQPPASGFFGMAHDPGRQRTVMYLGLAPGFHQLGAASPAPQTWEYDAGSHSWRRYRAAVEPGNLDVPALFYDEWRGEVLLVGGATPGGMNAGTYRLVPGP